MTLNSLMPRLCMGKFLIRCAFFTCALVALSPIPHAKADLVYDNSLTYLGEGYNPGANEVGDEIILGPGSRTATNFTFEYYGLNFYAGGVTNEQAELRFYLNDGSGGAPNTQFYDSGQFDIPETNRATLHFDLRFEDLELPDSFTWTVQFFGIDPGESAGLTLYSPPTIGTNYTDFWERDLAGWTLRTNSDGVTPMDFGAQVYAFDLPPIPEPATVAIGLLAGLALLVVKFSRRRE